MKIYKIFLILFSILLLTSCANKIEEEKVINTYKSDIVCHMSIKTQFEDDSTISDSNIFIYTKDNLVTKAIYQSVSDITYLEDSFDDLINIYNGFDGISAISYVANNKIVLEIKYDYDKIDIDEVKSKLGNLLDDDNLFNKVKKIPVTIDEFKKIELIDYECEG